MLWSFPRQGTTYSPAIGLTKRLSKTCPLAPRYGQREKRSGPTQAVGRQGRSQPARGAMGKITIAVEGCCHGELDKIYATLQHLEQREGKKIDLLICCGDFQAVRNLDDLETMACPQKYRSMQTFYKYYSGERVAPYPTLFIGGNHEAANHLWELYHGGWAAPNIYFLGFAGAVRFGGLRIAGLSGIYKSHDYLRGHHEALPYNDKTIRSMYHIRDFEVYRLMQLQQPVDIFLSHDWPTGIARYGNMQQLLARKSFLRSEVEDGTLGSPPAAELLAALRPAYWFSAHLHTKFAALVQHPVVAPGAGAGASAGGQAQGQGQGGQQQGGQGAGGAGPGGTTRFLALDKCLPGRDFLQVLELDAPGPPELHYDEEWLAVMRSTHHLVNLRFAHAPLPGMGRLRAGPKPEDVDFVRRALAERGGSQVPSNFTPTAPAYDPAAGQRRGRMPQHHVRNPQTVELLELLGLPYNLEHGAAGAPGQRPAGGGQQQQGTGQSHRAPLMVGGRLAAPLPSRPHAAAAAAVAAPNPEEIDLGDLDDDEAEQEDAQQQQQPEPGQGQGQGQQGAAGGQEAKGACLADDPMFQPLDL